MWAMFCLSPALLTWAEPPRCLTHNMIPELGYVGLDQKNPTVFREEYIPEEHEKHSEVKRRNGKLWQGNPEAARGKQGFICRVQSLRSHV